MVHLEPYSARYAGEHGDDYKNNIKLLDEMKNFSGKDRNARFVCVISLINEFGEIKVVRGEVEGYIIKELKNEGGFGYDPLFFYEGFNKTFGEATAEEKNSISHRGNALKKLKDILKKVIKYKFIIVNRGCRTKIFIHNILF